MDKPHTVRLLKQLTNNSMKKLMLTISIVLTGVMSFAQTLTVYNKDGKWGWKDEKGKKVVIEAKFEAERGFKEETGLAQVKLDGKWGMIDKTGKTVVPFEFLDFARTLEGLTAACKERLKWGLIDNTGKEVTEMKFSSMYTSPYGDYWMVKTDGKWGMLDLKGKEITQMKYDAQPAQTSVKPAMFKATANGNEYSISDTGVETLIGSKAPENNNASGGSSNANAKPEKCNYQCKYCAKTAQGSCNASNNGITISGCTVGSGSSSYHSWQKQ